MSQAGMTGGSPSLILTEQLLATHPWSLSGGGAVRVAEPGRCSLRKLDSAPSREVDRTHLRHWRRRSIIMADPRNLGYAAVSRDSLSCRSSVGRLSAIGSLAPQVESLFPIRISRSKRRLDDAVVAELALARNRSVLNKRREPGGTHEEIGLTWFEYSRWHPERYMVPLGIAFPFVATHNHFALDRRRESLQSYRTSDQAP